MVCVQVGVCVFVCKSDALRVLKQPRKKDEAIKLKNSNQYCIIDLYTKLDKAKGTTSTFLVTKRGSN